MREKATIAAHLLVSLAGYRLTGLALFLAAAAVSAFTLLVALGLPLYRTCVDHWDEINGRGGGAA